MNENLCESLKKLQDVLRTLTGPDGCPWDKVQTPLTLADYLIEESHELASAIRSGNAGDVAGELGDLAFLILFVAQYYEQAGQFSLADALDGIRHKMIRRHPHVFAGAEFSSLNEQLQAWEQIKKEEKAKAGSASGLFASLPESLPALVKAYRIHSKAARAGFTWPTDEDVEMQAESEWLEWLDVAQGNDQDAQKHELGDMLFTLVELGRRKGIKSSEALDFACRRFLARYALMEEMARENGRELSGMSLDEQDELWLRAKENLAADESEKPSG